LGFSSPQYFEGYPLAFIIAVCQYIDMVCVYCGQSTDVTNSRLQKKSNSIWRRRHCQKCNNVFTTHELIDWSGSIVVSDLRGPQMAPFSRDKLFISIYKSCGHRHTAINDASALVETIIQQLLIKKDRNRALVTKSDIIKTVQDVLSRFDKVAAVAYGAYHPG